MVHSSLLDKQAMAIRALRPRRGVQTMCEAGGEAARAGGSRRNGSPLLQALSCRTLWDHLLQRGGRGCSVHTKRDESLSSLMKGHSILRSSERYLFLQQNNFIAEVPLAAVTTDLTGYLIYQGYRSDWEGIVAAIIQVNWETW